MAKAKPTSIRLDENLYERVVTEAKKNKRSISAQIEFIIEKYYEIRDNIKN
jgi:hypothetical protein